MPTSGQSNIIENSTLQKALKSITPNLHESALSATFVRTIYRSQTEQEFSENSNLETRYATTSKLFVGNNGIRESVSSADAIGQSVEQHSLHYSNNGTSAMNYDSVHNRGTVRKNPNKYSNFLSSVLSPYAAMNPSRFIAHTKSFTQSKLNDAKITLETVGVMAGIECITLEGEYEKSDPERYFKITIIPAFNYAIAMFEEYDKNRRILAEVSSVDFVNVSGGSADIWLPKQTAIRKYRYDDYEGKSIELATLEILEPRIVTADENMFSISFANDAKLYDATSGVDLGQLIQEANKVSQDAIDDIGEKKIMVNKKQRKTLPHAKTGRQRTLAEGFGLKAFLKKDDINAAKTRSAQENILQTAIPHSNLLLVRILRMLLIMTAAVVVLCVIRKKIIHRNTKKAITKGGDVDQEIIKQ